MKHIISLFLILPNMEAQIMIKICFIIFIIYTYARCHIKIPILGKTIYNYVFLK